MLLDFVTATITMCSGVYIDRMNDLLEGNVAGAIVQQVAATSRVCTGPTDFSQSDCQIVFLVMLM